VFRKGLLRIVSVYFVISLVLVIVCAGVVAVDCVNRVRTGEFRILPVLDLTQFETGSKIEEVVDPLPQAAAYIQQLNESAHGVGDPLWRFINTVTILSLCNIPLFLILRAAGIRFPRYARRAMLAGCMIALFLIFAARLYVRGTYGRLELRFRYPAAWISWRELGLAAILLGGIAGAVKLLTSEGPEGE